MHGIWRIFTGEGVTTAIPKVSVIVRQHNELLHLPKLFQSLREQKNLTLEIVVVDSGSTDGSLEFAEKNADKLVKIKPLDFTFGYSLNSGIRVAEGTFILIISAHTYPTSQYWAEKLILPFEDKRVCMTYGRQIGAPFSNPSENQDFELLFPKVGRRQKAPDYFTNNANSAIRRDLWEQKQFDESLSGLEDIEWAKHFLDSGWEMEYSPDAEIVHIHNESPTQIRNRFYREAIALRRMGLKRRYNILSDLTKEVLEASKDLSRSPDIRRSLIYRYNKILGHAKGVMRGPKGDQLYKQEIMETLSVSDNISLVVKSPGQCELEDRPIPTLSPNDVLIQPSYVGVCGTDREILAGKLGYYASGKAKYPIVMGHEYSGVVARVGSRVTGLKVGDRVVGECIITCGSCGFCSRDHRLSCHDRNEVGVLHTDGALARLVRVPGDRVHKVPHSLSLIDAALTEPLSIVIHALKSANLWGEAGKLKFNHRILICGLGSLGNLATQLLAQIGFRNLVILDKSARKLQLVNSIGEKHTKASKELIQNTDMVIDFTGSGDLLKEILRDLPSESTLLLVGFPYENAGIIPESVVGQQWRIQGTLGADSSDFEDAISLLPKLNLRNHQENIYSLAKYKEAFERSSQDEVLKVLFKMQQDSEMNSEALI